MKQNNTKHKKRFLYILASQTGTVVSRIIRLVTKDNYNHVSISLDSDLEKMYSFGRIFPNNPILAGFVREDPKEGIYKKFFDTKVRLIKIEVTEEEYNEVKKILEEMYSNRRKYHYNYIGLITAYWDKAFSRKNTFYCSEFVRDLLVRTNILDASVFSEVAKPNDFVEIYKKESIYEGYLRDYIQQKEVILS